MTRLLVCLFLAATVFSTAVAESPVALNGRRELFVDDHLIESQSGEIQLRLHEPKRNEVAMVFNKPWEGNTSGYPTIMYDGELYRMIYRGHRMTWASGKLLMANSPVVCYAESKDGIHWQRPELNLYKWQGKDRDQLTDLTSNNIVWPGSSYSGTFVPFDDANPACKPAERFKAIGGNHKVGLHLFTSPDAIHWVKRDAPIFTTGALDSMNTMFWDSRLKKYTLYFRTVRDRLRSIDVAYSENLRTWTEAIPLSYGDSPPQQMYTNGIEPYYRAPHIFVGFPTRYTARPITDKLAGLPPVELRKELGDAYARVASDLTDGLFMTSRDGLNFKRWDEAFLRPTRENSSAPGSWMYGDNYQSYGLFETKTVSGETEISFMVNHGYWQEYKSRLQRYSIRPDGFVSLQATYAGGEVVTRAVTFTGNTLQINYATSAGGYLKVELQDEQGDAIPGFRFADCDELIGNSLDQAVVWKGGDLQKLTGKAIRIRFGLRDADLYSFQFIKRD